MKQIKTLLTAEEKVNLQLLEITDGMLTRVTDSNKLIGSLVLPDSVVEIGMGAFYCCTGLTSVKIPDSVHKIDKWSFFSCTALTSVAISKSVTEIGSMVFTGCINLTKLTVDSANPVYCTENNIIYTKDKKKLIVAASGLEHIVIPDSVTDIGGPFYDCTRLANLTVGSENTVYYSENNIIYTKDKKKLIAAASGLESVVIPEGVTEIGEHAFSACSVLTDVVIPNTVTDIAKSAFYGCTHLTKLIVDIENPVYCSENNIIYTKDKKKLIAVAGGLEHIVIPDTVSDIGGWGFFDCTRLTHLSVDSENPVYCSEGNIIYTKDKKKLIAAASCLRSVVIADGVTEIPSWGFSACSNLTDVVIPDTVTEIGDMAFFDCSFLTNVIIPNNVTTIGDHAFSYCSKLKTVIIDSAVVTDIEDNVFENVHADVHFTVKTDKVKALLKKSDSSIRDEQITVVQVCE